MNHPLSHTSAVVAAVLVIVWMIVIWMAIDEPSNLKSAKWWAACLLCEVGLLSSVVAYFRPSSWFFLVPFGIASAFLLMICLFFIDRLAKSHGQSPWVRLALGSFVFTCFGGWLAMKICQIVRERNELDRSRRRFGSMDACESLDRNHPDDGKR